MNKKYSILFSALLIFSLFFSCEKSTEKQKYYQDSSGPINLVSVFATQDLYKSMEAELNDSLIFGKTFPGLYYPAENMFATRQFDPDLMKRFNNTRLVLDVAQGEASIKFEKNKFAKPQAYIQVIGNSKDEILNQLISHQDSILNFYRWADREFLLDGYKSKDQDDKNALNTLGVDMLIPNDYTLAENNADFVWYRKDNYNTIQNRDNRDDGVVTEQSQDMLNILLFKVPYTKDEVVQEDVYFLMDSITRIYTKGSKQPQERYIQQNNGKDSIKISVSDHIQVEMNPMLSDAYDFTKIKETSATTEYEAQGWWSMTLSQLGGPFTAKLILDKKNNTLYVADAVLFAPLNQGKSKKRDYITAMESLFTTFKIKE